MSAHLLPEVGVVVLERTLARGVSGGSCSETPVFPRPGIPTQTATVKGLRRARTTTAQRGLHCPNRAAGASTSNRQSTFCRGGAPQGRQARERQGGRWRRATERLEEGGKTPPIESPLWGYHRATGDQRLQEDAVRGRQRRGRVAAGARRPGARQFWVLGAPKGTISRSFVVSSFGFPRYRRHGNYLNCH